MTFPERREFRLLITGSRDWRDAVKLGEAIIGVVDAALDRKEDIVVVHGDCPTGADRLAHEFCEANSWWVDNLGYQLAVEAYPADWPSCSALCPDKPHRKRRRDGVEYCPIAGHARNQHMVDLGAHLALAFPMPGSRGTWDCVKRARAAGIEVRVIRP